MKSYTENLDALCISPQATVHEAVQRMEENRFGLCLVTDVERMLLGTISDGDVRRAILAQTGMNQPVKVLLDRKQGPPYERSVTGKVGLPPNTYVEIMNQRKVVHLPLVDREGKLKDLVRMMDIVPSIDPPLRAVVMAGGKGSRLSPLTENVPKPMLPVGKRPLLEHIIGKLKVSGIHQVNVTTHYKAEMIEDHFGDGSEFCVELGYVSEAEPLGTAGSLALLGESEAPLLVINGDVLTDLDIQAMLHFHEDSVAAMTVGVREYDVQIPYGIVECEGSRVVSVDEKPVKSFFVNAGVYLLQPAVREYIPRGRRFDMTELMQMLIEHDEKVVSFPIHEYWIDVGQISDYERAQSDYEKDTGR